MRRVRKFLSLSSAERLLLIKAVLLVFAIRLGLTLLPFSTFRKYLAKGQERRIDADQEPSIDHVAWSVAAASHYVPKATCLTRALALQVLLHHGGYPAALQIGVRKDEKGQFQAHAWVESQGRIIDGGPGYVQYRPLLIGQNEE